MDRKTAISDHFMHVGSGTSMVFAWLGLIPGVIPFLALTVLVTAVLVAPVLVLGAAAVLLGAPPYAVWRLATRTRRAREAQVRPIPLPTPHAS